ncbi:MAG TPA: DUF4835 family protein [Bacteroidales bacterium]|nr:DUF4835 family protein [Bacteroidales bacterium]
MDIKKIIILLFSVLLSTQVSAQELDCNVRVNSRMVEGSDKQVFNNMQKAIFEFMNNTKWTDYEFQINERVECTFLFTINERISADEFSGKLNVVVRRPVFGSSYNTPLLNWEDKNIHFYFIESQPIEFNENTYTTNLASILAFYSNIILGLDFDSFEKFGGTEFFTKAQNIVSIAQSGNETGWSSFDSQKNRYWLAENYTNNSYAAIREASYLYHRQGLDKMQDNVDIGRSKVVEAIELLKVVNEQRPNLFILKLFLEAKSDEIVDIFKEGTSMEKTTVVNILKELDPANSSQYDKIMQNN